MQIMTNMESIDQKTNEILIVLHYSPESYAAGVNKRFSHFWQSAGVHIKQMGS